MAAFAVASKRGALLFSKSHQSLGNYFLRRSKVTRLQLIVDDPFLLGS